MHGEAVGGPGVKRHININFLLWLTSRWPWDKQLVVPGLTGPKRFMCSPRNTGNINFFLWCCPDFQKVYGLVLALGGGRMVGHCKLTVMALQKT